MFQPKKRKQVVLSKEDIVFATEIDTHLELELFELLIYKLNGLNQQGKLFALLKYDHYRLFDWALEHGNLDLINYMLENLSHTNRFIMLQYKDYSAIKAFINVSKNLEWNAHVKHNVVPILKSILKFEPNWQILEIIENSFSDQSSLSNIDTIKKLKSCLKLTQSNSQVLETPKKQKIDLTQEPDFPSICSASNRL